MKLNCHAQCVKQTAVFAFRAAVIANYPLSHVAYIYFHIRVYAKYPSLLAEMYAYSMAAAHTELPHFTLHNLMVSNVHADDEGWKWIDALGDNVCEDPVDGVYYPGHNMPAVLHFCQFYRAAEIGFQKRRIKKELFNCDSPMMLELPKDLGTVDYKNRDGEVRYDIRCFVYFVVHGKTCCICIA